MDTADITFYRKPDGSITADGFPPRIRISEAFLKSARDVLVRHGHDVTFCVANGEATYRLRGAPENGVFVATRRHIKHFEAA